MATPLAGTATAGRLLFTPPFPSAAVSSGAFPPFIAPVKPSAFSGSPTSSQNFGIALPTLAISVLSPSVSQTGDQVLTVEAITQAPPVQPGPSGSVGEGADLASASLTQEATTAQVLTADSPGVVSSLSTSPVPAPSYPPLSLVITSTSAISSTLSAAAVPMEQAESHRTADNIFNPANRLFPLGVTAVSVGGIFIAILSIWLIIRLTGCTKRRRRRSQFDNSQHLPSSSSVNVRNASLSFHDQPVYRDDPPFSLSAVQADAEKGASGREGLGDLGRVEFGGEGRYPAFIRPENLARTGGAASGGGRGWDTTHIPAAGMGRGIASTLPIRYHNPSPARSPRHSDSGYTAYEQIFFPTSYTNPTRHNRTHTDPNPLSHISGRPLATYDTLIAEIRSSRDSSQLLYEHRADVGTPLVTSGRSELVLANPDLSRRSSPALTPRPRIAPHIITTPPDPIPSQSQPLHVQYRGGQPRTLRHSTSTLSSYNSGQSSPSAYSNTTQGQLPTFKFDRPTPSPLGRGVPFSGLGMDGGRMLLGVGMGRERGSGTESLDVPRDAVSRPGSERTGRHHGRAVV